MTETTTTATAPVALETDSRPATTPDTECEPVYVLDEVSKSYRAPGGLRGTVVALATVSMVVNDGELVALLGSTGIGKSTLLSGLGGMDRPSSGTIRFRGQPLTRKLAAQVRGRQIGFVFQNFNLLAWKTALDNVAMALLVLGVPRRTALREAKKWLEKFGLKDRLKHYPDQLSGGEKQRVAIARAIAPQCLGNRLVILADEPTGNLDEQTSRGILDVLRQLNREHGATIVLVTHDRQAAHDYADRIIELEGSSTA